MKKKIIRINEDFEMHRDKYQWVLWHWTDGKDKYGDPKRQKRETYHSTIEQICCEVLDRRAGECETLVDIRNLLENAATVLIDSLKAKIEAE